MIDGKLRQCLPAQGHTAGRSRSRSQALPLDTHSVVLASPGGGALELLPAVPVPLPVWAAPGLLEGPSDDGDLWV